MANVHVRPTGDVTHDLALSDGTRTFGIKLQGGARGIVETPATPTNIRINQAGAKFGDFDPSMAHIEQRDWSGGRGLKLFVDDPQRFYDGSAWTMTRDVLLNGLQWQLTTGTIPWSADLPGSVEWRGLFADERYLARNFTPTTTYNSTGAFFWVRKVGNPGDLTLGFYSSGTGAPGASTAAFTLVSAAVPDSVSVFIPSTWAAVSFSSGKDYWAVLSGDSSATLRNHWEVGCQTSAGGGMRSSNGSAWVGHDAYPYYLSQGPPLDVKWHFFSLSSVLGTSQVLHAVSQDNSSAANSSTLRLTGVGTWSTVAWTSALTGVVKDVAVIDNVAYMARGGGTAMFAARVQNSSNEGQSVDTTSVADYVHNFYDPVDGPQLYRAVSSAARVYRASTVAFATTQTWKPSTGVPVGEAGFPIVDMIDYDNQIYVRKADDLWAIKSDRAAKINVGLGAVPSSGIYSPMYTKDLYLYLAWSYSLERLYGATLDDIGPWKGIGLPSSRVGVVSCLEGAIGWMFCGIDAGSTGVSSVLAWDGRGYHEVFRAPVAGWRVQNLKWWAPIGTRPRLFISCGGMIFTVAFPFRSLNPELDRGGAIGSVPLTYQHESVVETGSYDLGSGQLPKLFDVFQARSQNLNSSGVEVRLDYQVDNEIGGSTWIQLPDVWRQSPSDEAAIRQGDKRAIRMRQRMITNNSSTPVHLDATVLKAVARTPVKRRWTIKAKAGTFQVDLQGNADADPDVFYAWLQDAAVRTVPLHMRAAWDVWDDTWVYMEPPVFRPTYRVADGSWGFDLDIVFREV